MDDELRRRARKGRRFSVDDVLDAVAALSTVPTGTLPDRLCPGGESNAFGLEMVWA